MMIKIEEDLIMNGVAVGETTGMAVTGKSIFADANLDDGSGEVHQKPQQKDSTVEPVANVSIDTSTIVNACNGGLLPIIDKIFTIPKLSTGSEADHSKVQSIVSLTDKEHSGPNPSAIKQEIEECNAFEVTADENTSNSNLIQCGTVGTSVLELDGESEKATENFEVCTTIHLPMIEGRAEDANSIDSEDTCDPPDFKMEIVESQENGGMNESYGNLPLCNGPSTRTFHGSFPPTQPNNKTLELRATLNPTTKIYQLECVQCQTRLNDMTHFLYHSRAHSYVLPHECHICGLKTKGDVSLFSHYRTHTNDVPVEARECNENDESLSRPQCTVCLQQFSSKYALENHAKRFHIRGYVSFKCEARECNENDESLSRPQCTVCLQQFSSKYALENHAKRFHIRGYVSFKCKLCSKGFTKRVRLLKHTYKAHRAEYSCRECPKVFIVKSTLLRHMESHKQRFRCGDCNLELANQEELNQHMAGHAKQRVKVEDCQSTTIDPNQSTRPTCNECGKIYMYQFSLNKHMKKHVKNPNQNVSFPCDVCGKSFKKRQSLSSHMTVHPKHSHACPHCQMTFATSVDLKRHVRNKHGGGEDYACLVCGKKQLTAYQLGKHIWKHVEVYVEGEDSNGKFKRSLSAHKNLERIHNGQCQSKCNVCGKAFKLRSTLSIHMKYHMEHPHDCLHCDKSFARSVQLKRHIRKEHGDRRTYSCKVCGIVLKKASCMKQHKKKHVDEKENKIDGCSKFYKCKVCGVEIRSRAIMRTHLNEHVGKFVTSCSNRAVLNYVTQASDWS